MTRRDHPSGTDRIAEVARSLDADLYVNLQGDEPLIDPNALDRLVELMERDSGAGMATLGRAAHRRRDIPRSELRQSRLR